VKYRSESILVFYFKFFFGLVLVHRRRRRRRRRGGDASGCRYASEFKRITYSNSTQFTVLNTATPETQHAIDN
jgi:hypothetical protein